MRAINNTSATWALLLLLPACSRNSPGVAWPTGSGGADRPSVADIAEHALPSVVNVSTSTLVRSRRSPLLDDPFFRFFFDHPRFHGEPNQPERTQRSLGSGVIVGQGGIVLTNNHVIKGAHQIRVITADGRDLRAVVVGHDERSDIAVLRLQGDVSALPAMPFGNSDELRLGDFVLAIGNPFGVGQTVTMGIVSAKGRSNMGIIDYEDFIQTDAAINPGNSGGALVNMKGELIGINTAIVSRSGGYQGVGFAIPSNMARQIERSIREHGKVVRGWLGVALQDLTPELASAVGAKGRLGVLVADVEAGSPAERVGIKRGDVILRASGQPAGSAARLRSVIASSGAGATLALEILRDGSEQRIRVVLSEQPEARGDSTRIEENEGVLGGISLSDLSEQVREKHDIPERLEHGVIVKSIASDSPVARTGLRAGDVIVELNRQKIGSVHDFLALYRRAPTQLLLLVYRAGSTLYLLLQNEPDR